MAPPKQIKFDVKLEDGKTQTFMFDKWPTSKVIKRFSKIGRYLAVPMTMLMSGGKEASQNAIPEALLYLFNVMEEDDVLEFFKFILDGVTTGNGTVSCSEQFDIAFAADDSMVIDVIAKVLTEHYSPFFKRGFQPLVGILAPMTQAQIEN